MVGYRGVAGSTVLDCLEYVSALRISDPLSAPSLTKLSEAATIGCRLASH